MNNLTKLAAKIHNELQKNKSISGTIIKKFEKLNREEGKEILRYIIKNEKNPKIKNILFRMHEEENIRYDKRLFILSIWTAFSI